MITSGSRLEIVTSPARTPGDRFCLVNSSLNGHTIPSTCDGRTELDSVQLEQVRIATISDLLAVSELGSKHEDTRDLDSENTVLGYSVKTKFAADAESGDARKQSLIITVAKSLRRRRE